MFLFSNMLETFLWALNTELTIRIITITKSIAIKYNLCLLYIIPPTTMRLLIKKNKINLVEYKMNFEAFFGISKESINKNCIICQNFDISLFSSKVSKDIFVKTANIKSATIIA